MRLTSAGGGIVADEGDGQLLRDEVCRGRAGGEDVQKLQAFFLAVLLDLVAHDQLFAGLVAAFRRI